MGNRWLMFLLITLLLVNPMAIAEEQLVEKSAYAYGTAIQQPLVGKLEIVKLDKKGKKYSATLVLDESVDLTGIPDAQNVTHDYKNVTRIALDVPNKNGGKRVRVTGTVSSSVGLANATTPYALKNVKVSVIPAAKSVSLRKSASLAIGGTLQLSASISPSTAEQKISWRVVKGTSVSVSATGLVTALAKGTASVRASAPNGKYATCSVTVVVPVKGIALSQKDLTLVAGKAAQLKATITPADASNKGLIWKSNNSKIASVSSKGKVSAKKAGSATITATSKDGNFSTTCAVKVESKITKLKLSPSSKTLEVGQTQKIAPVVSPSNASNKTVLWGSNKPTIATVDKNGLVTAVAPGEAKITGRTLISGKTATAKIKVVAATVPVISVSVSPTTASVEVGKTKQLTTTVQPSNATDKTLTWASSDTSVATVSASGLVTAKKSGTATITAKAKNGVSGTCKVTVTASVIPVTGVSVSPASASIEVGKTKQLAATVQPSNASEKALTWTSDDTSVATVSTAGLVTAKKAGSATITAKTKNGVSGTCKVTVTDTAVAVTGVTVSPATASVEVGFKRQFTATVLPANAADKSLTWTSSDTSVASVSASGLVYGYRAGTTTITAKAKNGVYGSCIVTVPIPPIYQIYIDYQDTERFGLYDFLDTDIEIMSGCMLYGLQSMQLNVILDPDSARWPNIVWSSSDPTVATVSSTGLLKTLKAGYAVISAKTGLVNEDGDRIESALLVLVADAPASGISPQDEAIFIDGKKLLLPATFAQVSQFFPNWVKILFQSGDGFYYTKYAIPDGYLGRDRFWDFRHITFQYFKDEESEEDIFGGFTASLDQGVVTTRGVKSGTPVSEVLNLYGVPDEVQFDEWALHFIYNDDDETYEFSVDIDYSTRLVTRIDFAYSY